MIYEESMIEGIRRILRNLCQKHLNRFNESVLRKKQISSYLIYERKNTRDSMYLK